MGITPNWRWVYSRAVARPGRRRPQSYTWIAAAALVPLVLLNLVLAILTRRLWGVDLHGYLAGATVAAQLGWSHLYDPAAQEPLIQPYATAANPWQPYVSPPLVALLVSPLRRVPFPVAYAIWTTIGVAAVGIGAALLAPPRAPSRIAVVLLFFALTDVMLAVTAGNVISLLVLALGVGWALLRQGHAWAGGAVIGLLVLKPQVAVLVPLCLLVAGQWRALGGAALTALAVAAISVLLLGTAGVAGWIHLAGRVSSLSGQQLYTLSHAAGGGVLGAAAAAIAGIAALAAAYRSRGRGPAPALAIGLVGSILVTRYVNVGDFAWLPAAALLLLNVPLSRAQRVAAFGLAASAFAAIGSAILLTDLAMLAAVLTVLFGARTAVRPATPNLN
jgi:hypothetical protein